MKYGIIFNFGFSIFKGIQQFLIFNFYLNAIHGLSIFQFWFFNFQKNAKEFLISNKIQYKIPPSVGWVFWSVAV